MPFFFLLPFLECNQPDVPNVSCAEASGSPVKITLAKCKRQLTQIVHEKSTVVSKHTPSLIKHTASEDRFFFFLNVSSADYYTYTVLYQCQTL